MPSFHNPNFGQYEVILDTIVEFSFITREILIISPMSV